MSREKSKPRAECDRERIAAGSGNCPHARSTRSRYSADPLAAARATLANDILVKTHTKLAIACGSLLLLAGIIRLAQRGAADGGGVDGGAPSSSTSDMHTAAPDASLNGLSGEAVDAIDSASRSVDAPDASDANVLVRAKWGNARGDLGRERLQEGNAEGPMSFATGPNGELVVLDQVNRRVVRYDRKGKVTSVSDAPPTTQDVAVARDGSTALLDRLSAKSITLTDPSGKKIGELSLERSKAGDPGLLTGVFVDGKDVYVEKEHGALVLVGTTDGRPAEEAVQLAGRPSRDGTLLLHASMAQGRVVLNAIDRKTSTSRFARAIPFARPLRAIVLLDSDLRGTIYIGASAGPPNEAQIVCADPSDGRVLGRLTLPTSAVPEESFRDFTVADDGTIFYAVRSEEGVTYSSARCP
jgi:hypothetical protein